MMNLGIKNLGVKKKKKKKKINLDDKKRIN